MEKFRKLEVWEKSHKFTLEIYNITKSFPSDEKFGLTSQIRRASASVPTNIVEGSKRATIADRSHFHTIALGSIEEVKYLLILCTDLGYIQKEKGRDLYNQARVISGMLHNLTKSIQSTNLRPPASSI